MARREKMTPQPKIKEKGTKEAPQPKVKGKKGPQPKVRDQAPQPKVRQSKKIDRNSDNVTFFDMIRRLHAAKKARQAEEGGRNKKQFEKNRQALVNEAQIETTLANQFQEYVDQLLQGELNSFTLTITSEAYPYFNAMVKSKKYANIKVQKLQGLQYIVQLRNADMLL